MEQQDTTNHTNKDEIDLIEVFFKIWRFRKFIIYFTIAIAILGIIYALIQPPVYEASVKLYKTTQEKGSRMQDLASQFGVGGASMTQAGQFSIKDLLQTRRIHRKLIYHKWETEAFQDSVNLITFWEIGKDAEEGEGPTKKEKFISAYKKLKDQITVSVNEETSLITVKVMMQDSGLAADMANYITDLVIDYAEQERKTSTKRNLNHITERLETVEQELREAEEDLKQFRENNQAWSQSPELQMQYGRLQRRVSVKEQVYMTLQQEKETAKIELVKQTPVINVIDEAIAPIQPAKPNKKLIVIVATFAGFFLSILIVVLRYVYFYIKQEIERRGERLQLIPFGIFTNKSKKQ